MAVSHKRRNSEKRKEKSRDAARSRRGKEAEIFSELASQLPMPPATIDALDKASVMRLLLSTLKVKSVMEKRPKLEMPDEGSLEAKIDTFYPKALEGFLIIFSKEGDIIYVSESVCKVLGMQQIDLMGQSVYEFSHPCDHEELQEIIDPHSRADDREASKTVFIRMKCTLTSKGRSVNLKSATYKVIRLSGRYIPDDVLMESMDNSDSEPQNDVPMKEENDEDYETEDEDRVRVFKPQLLPHFLAVGEAIRHPSNIEVPLDKRTFITRHNMNMKFTHCDERIKRLIGYQSDEMIGQSFYSFHHAIDSKMMEKAFKDLFAKGQVTTGQYRFLAKNGGYVWMVTEATVIFNNRSQKPDYVVCVHYVLSRVEQHGRVLAEVQLPTVSVKEEDFSDNSCDSVKASPPSRSKTSTRPCRRRDVKVADIFHVPTFSTEAVFGDKTEDMDEDYNYLSGTKKTFDSYESLNQMSPQDVPLDIPTFDSIKHGDQYGTSISMFDDMPVGMKMGSPLLHRGDNLRDPHLANSLSTTPDNTMSGTPSPVAHLRTINPNDISAMKDIFTTISTRDENKSGTPSPVAHLRTINPNVVSMKDIFTTIDTCDENKDIDFTTRAPYIPMNSDEDFALCQPSSDSFLSMGADFNPGIFGSTENVINLRDELYDGPPPEKKSKTAIDMVDGSTVKKSIDRPQDQMILKLKRPLNRSCLERGPPFKMSKYQKPNLTDSRILENASRNGSVLLNLLLNGEDVDNGYSVRKKNISRRESGDFIQHLLSTVTSHDIEANLPTGNGNLLQGQDLMAALNMNRK